MLLPSAHDVFYLSVYPFQWHARCADLRRRRPERISHRQARGLNGLVDGGVELIDWPESK